MAANGISTNAKAPVDPNVIMPAAVRRAAEASDAARVEAYGEPPTPAPDDGTINIVAPSLPANSPSTNFTVSDAPPIGELLAPTPQVTPVDDDNSGTWKHKFESTNARYIRQNSTVKQQADEITNLRNLIETMAMQPQAAPPSVPIELSAAELITPEERETFGDDFLAVVGKRAQEAMRPMLASRDQEIDNLKRQLGAQGKVVSTNARQSMFNALAEKVPNWEEVNIKDEFLMWLDLPDAYTGTIRKKLLSDAFERNEAPRVIAFFKGFLSEEAATAPQPGSEQPPADQPARPSLEEFAAPGRAKNAASTLTPVEKPIITPAHISQFYLDVNRGKYRGRDDEKNRIEAEIFAAQRDGRIRS